MNDTICSVATSLGVGAISIIRVSGLDAISIVNKIFKGKNLEKVKSHTVHYGHIIDNLEIIDEVLVTVMRSPKTYTTEDVVEINCHGGIETTNKKMDVFVSDNNFIVANASDANYVNTPDSNAVHSAGINYIFCNNKLYFEKTSTPKHLFHSTSATGRNIKCGSFSALDNEFYTYNTNYGNRFVKNLSDTSASTDSYFIEGYFGSVSDSGNTFTLLSTETTSQAE